MRLLWTLFVALLSLNRTSAEKGQIKDATVEVVHIGLTHPGDDILKQSVAVFRVVFAEQLALHRKSNASIDQPGFYPEQLESHYGLVQIRCGDVVVDSFPSEESVQDVDYVPDFLVPEVHATAFPLAEMASLLTAPNTVRDPHTSFYAGILFLGDKARGQGSGVMPNDVSGCRLRFLPPAEQKWSPAGYFQRGSGAPFLADDISFAAAGHVGWPSRAGTPVDLAAAERAGQLAGTLLRHTFVGDEAENATRAAEPEKPAQCVPLPQGLEHDSPMVLLESTKEIPGLGGMVLGIMDGLLSPMMGAIAGTIVGLLSGGAYADNMAQSSDKGFDAEITSFLTHETSRLLSESLAAPLSAALPTAVEEAVAGRFATEVAERVTDSLRDRVTGVVVKAVSSSVPTLVVSEEPEMVARATTISLAHTLTRSLTHTIVPALAHTLTHNPLSDYYCYYCYHDKVYCQYCHYSPQQLYYSMYYSGFYSAYYADYFSRYFTAHLSTKPAHKQAQKFESVYTRVK